MSGIIHSWPIEIDFNRAQIRSRIKETDVLDLKSVVTYIIFTDGSKYYAKNGDTGMIEYSDADVSNLLQNVINVLYQRYGGGRIFIKRGIYYPTKTVNIPDGISLAIKGEGSNTVLRYTSRFILFIHDPSSPTWTSNIAIRNFKVDRSGSGENNTDIILLKYARSVVVEGLEIVDDYRNVDGDGAITGFNNFNVVVRGNRIFNKSYGIYIGGLNVHIYDNYVENTGKVGIASMGLWNNTAWGLKLPSGYGTGGVIVIESNALVDCGRADECLAIDYSGYPPDRSVGVIRDNIVITKNYSTYYVFSLANADAVYVERNRVNVQCNRVFEGATSGNNKLVFINNIIDAACFWNLANLQSKIIMFKGNGINYVHMAGSDIVGTLFGLTGDFIVFRDNDMYVNMNGYRTYQVIAVVERTPLEKPLTMTILDNRLYVSSCFDVIWLRVYNQYTGQLFKPILIAKRNNIWGSGQWTFNIGFRSSGDMLYIIGRENIVTNIPYSIQLSADSGLNPVVYLDVDVNSVGVSAGAVNIFYLKKNSGTATILAGNTRVTVNHRLASTPTKIQITPLGQPPGKLWVENITSTSFDIVTDTAPTVNLIISWYAEV